MSGECSCRPGWAGLHCNETCPHDTHGPGCQEHCLCLHGGVCQPDSGLCRCAPGYTVRRAARPGRGPGPDGRADPPPRRQGPHCASLCPPDTYGVNCSARCACENAIACSPIDGSCVCKEGNAGAPPGPGPGRRLRGVREGPGGGAGAGRLRGEGGGDSRRWESRRAASFLPSPLRFFSDCESPTRPKKPAASSPHSSLPSYT